MASRASRRSWPRKTVHPASRVVIKSGSSVANRITDKFIISTRSFYRDTRRVSCSVTTACGENFPTCGEAYTVMGDVTSALLTYQPSTLHIPGYMYTVRRTTKRSLRHDLWAFINNGERKSRGQMSQKTRQELASTRPLARETCPPALTNVGHYCVYVLIEGIDSSIQTKPSLKCTQHSKGSRSASFAGLIKQGTIIVAGAVVCTGVVKKLGC